MSGKRSKVGTSRRSYRTYPALKRAELVLPNLRLVKPLAGGGMGRVWVADHLELKTRVAVKFISEDKPFDDPELIERFRQEASLTAQIDSPHVVRILDRTVMEDGTPCIVMELLEGEPLDVRLKRVGRLRVHQAAQIVVQVSNALSAAHRVGIIHRDIKPENIFLCQAKDGFFAKVFDFGIARQERQPKLERKGQPSRLAGTPEFMSPEIFRGAVEADHQVDLWALAVVAYLMLTGEVPFTGSSVATLATAVVRGALVLPSERASDLPKRFDQWFARALNPDPTKRFESAWHLASTFLQLVPAAGRDRLEQLLDDDGSSERTR